MSFVFELDLSRFQRALEQAPETVFTAAKRGMHDALDDWKREATDVAPFAKGTLRRGINPGDIEQNEEGLIGEITAVAVESSPKGSRFNYAYYLHEVKGEIKNPTTPGTTAKFLDEPAEKHGKRWVRMIEDEIEAEMRKGGW
ncbi:hypothetical protein [Brevibacillus thermoruber]|uniref:hypothetical protein n=1 Tax=Brevibacillus thermoruber TaxID=33942 RepID=UPI0003FCBD99|nr:hypothetical protein [Brevibacillus thermoruber]